MTQRGIRSGRRGDPGPDFVRVDRTGRSACGPRRRTTS